MYILENYKALGSACWIETFEIISKDKRLEISNQIIKLIIEFEDNYSRFKENSLLNLLNSERRIQNPSKEFKEILVLSELYRNVTNSVFDIKQGNMLTEMGYGKYYYKDDSSEKPEIVINENDINLIGSFSIDLGGIGKSFLIKKITDTLITKFNLSYFLINFGGDIFVTSNYEEKVTFHLENPKNPNFFIGKVELKNQALCCSSPYKRSWKDEHGVLNTHIISGNLKAVNSSFVFAHDIIAADIYATCLCLKPDLEVPDNISYIILDSDLKILGVK